jgi:PAS domain S-box-containing protein
LPAAPLPSNEFARLAALHGYSVLDTEPEAAFDDLARLASQICNTPIALISLVDRDRQWFKARVGFDAAELPREHAFCSHVVHGGQALVVADARADARFADGPLVTGPRAIRFYAGAPLVTPEGYVLGTLCAMDREPRELTPTQREGLEVLSRQVMAQLTLQKTCETLGGALVEQERLTEALRDRELRYRRIVESSNEGICLVAADGRIAFSNARLARMLGVRPGTLAARRLLDFVSIECVPLVEERLRSVSAQPVQERFEVRLRRDDATPLWAALGLSPLRDGESGDGGALVMVAEVTEQHEQAAALRQAEERWQLAIRGSNDGVWDWNVQSGAIYFSPRWKEMLGFGDDELPNLLDEWLGRIHPDDLPGVTAALQAHLSRAERQYLAEFRMRAKDGSWRWILARGEAIWNDQGQPVRMAGSHKDVTDRREAELALRESESRLRRMVEHLPVGAVYVDGEMIGFNSKAEEITGLRRQAISTLDAWFSRLFGPRAAEMRQIYETDRANDFPEPRVVPLARADGSRRLVEFVAYRDAQMELWLLHDVTELTAAHERFRVLFEFSSDVHLLFDEMGIIDCNRAAVDLLGCRDKRDLESLHPALLSPECQPDGRRSLEKAGEMIRIARERGHHRFEWIHRRMNGEEFPVEVALTPVRLDGRDAMIGVWHDLTERKRAEAALRATTENLSALVESAPMAICTVDPAGVVEHWNAAAARLFGWQAGEVVGRFLPTVPAEDESAWRDLWARVAAGETVVALERPRRCKDGRIIDVAISAAPLRDASGAARGLMFTYLDLTERRRAEQELQRYYEQVEESRALAERQAAEMSTLAAELAEARNQALQTAQLKSEFLATMSHEIRTPMNGVIGMTGLLLDTELTPEQRGFAETVRSSGETLLNLINDILDFSKIEAGKLALEAIDFDLRSCVEDVLDLLGERAQTKGLELASVFGPGVPSAVSGDPGRLRQVLTNLVGNAIKFTDAGEVLVTVDAERASEGGLALRVAVTDTGIGIPRDVQGRLFEPFTQADGSTTRKFGGSGLGLAISRQLVHLMGGEIGLTSEPGRGSAFWFTLRLGAARSPESLDTWVPDLRGVRVLCVAGHPAASRSVVSRVAEWGAAVDTAPSAAFALAALRAAAAADRAYDVVLIDRRLPDDRGASFARTLRGDPVLADTSVVLLQTWVAREAAATLRESRIDATATKPVRTGAIRAALVKALGIDHPDARVATATPAGPGAASLRLLVAEDNKVNQQVARLALQKLGHRVDLVANGFEAVDAVSRIPYDVVLMDCQMPDLDGYGATEAIRRLPGAMAQIPVIAMTANAMQGDRERCLAAGMDDYVTKPFQMDQLRAVLARWSQSRGTPVVERPGDGAAETHAAPAALDAPPIDPAVFGALRELEEEGAPGFLRELIDLYLSDLPGRLAELERAVAAGDAPAVQRAAHTLKGSSANLGARRVATDCEAIERDARSGSLARAAELLARVQLGAEQVRHALEEERRRIRFTPEPAGG